MSAVGEPQTPDYQLVASVAPASVDKSTFSTLLVENSSADS